jgi:hypothetical protein
MPNVLKCTVEECAYNEHENCHAMAITVDGPDPLCDTYFKTSRKGGVADIIGAVGACKNGECVHNQAFECAASGIEISRHEANAECDTFALR